MRYKFYLSILFDLQKNCIKSRALNAQFSNFTLWILYVCQKVGLSRRARHVQRSFASLTALALISNAALRASERVSRFEALPSSSSALARQRRSAAPAFTSYAARTSDAPRVMHTRLTRHTLVLRSRHRHLLGRENLVLAARSLRRVEVRRPSSTALNAWHARHKLWLIILGMAKSCHFCKLFYGDGRTLLFRKGNARECRWAEEIGIIRAASFHSRRERRFFYYSRQEQK